MWQGGHQSAKYRNPFKERPEKRFFSLYLIGTLLAVIFLFYLLILHPFWAIKAITIHGSYSVKQEELQALINDFLNQPTLFSRRHIFFFKNGKLADLLRERYSLDQINVTKKFRSRSIDVAIEGKGFIGYWVSRGVLFKLDKTGRIVDTVNTNEADASAVKIIDLDSQLASLNSQALPSEVVDFISQFYKNFGIERYAPKFWEVSQVTKQLSLVTKDNYRVYFDSQQPLQGQLSTLSRILDFAIPEADKTRVDYIDLRFGERVYYKLR